MKHPVAGIERWDGGDCGNSFGLANAFVVEKEKCPFFNNRTADGSAELITLEGGDLRTIEKIPGVQGAVAQEFVGASVKSPGS